MGGSRRRLKKTAPKVRVGLGPLKRKRTDKTKLPLELAQDKPSMPKRLDTTADWDQKRTLTANYQANKLLLDPNAGFGRNQTGGDPLKSSEARHEAGEDTFSDDDELRAGCNQERHEGKAPPPRLTSTQKKVVEKLLAKHGDDLHAMVLDTKLNPMQHSEGQLKKLITGFHHWHKLGAAARHDFRGPQKPYKRL